MARDGGVIVSIDQNSEAKRMERLKVQTFQSREPY
jgi:hypothetical protein